MKTIHKFSSLAVIVLTFASYQIQAQMLPFNNLRTFNRNMHDSWQLEEYFKDLREARERQLQSIKEENEIIEGHNRKADAYNKVINALKEIQTLIGDDSVYYGSFGQPNQLSYDEQCYEYVIKIISEQKKQYEETRTAFLKQIATEVTSEVYERSKNAMNFIGSFDEKTFIEVYKTLFETLQKGLTYIKAHLEEEKLNVRLKKERPARYNRKVVAYNKVINALKEITTLIGDDSVYYEYYGSLWASLMR